MPLKEKFNVTHSSPRQKSRVSPGKAPGGMPDFDQEAKQE